MPPSPATRRSPGKELRGDNHKRGLSLEGGIFLKEKNDDLALFNELQTKERDNFLLQSNDDFEDTFSTKLRYFSDHKIGISIPARGYRNDLLNAEAEKNDYDWLLTPPDTPLFPSLDDETPPVSLAQRGRPRSQPITISRSSTMETSHKSIKGSASPNRLSPPPRSGNSTFQIRGRTLSATPPRRPSPSPSKQSTHAPRSLTPTPRRMSTGSGGTGLSCTIRGISPVKTSRGNSASPKARAWKANIPGFSLDAPPNLRTSVADRPASYVRGSSPASRNGRDSSSRSGRQSMSPTASRSVSSSYSHDRDRFSSQSKGSIASSGDDDIESLQSTPMSNSDLSAPKRVGSFQNNRASAFSKKPTKAMLSSSAPKRSFDSALRQMDHRKGPQNMFRPLLSSVPSSTFYAGKATAAHRAMISRNSSVTTSSNASSDQGTSGAHDTEGSDHHQDDMASECGKTPYLDVREDVFAFEKADAVNEATSHGVHDGSSYVQRGDLSGGVRVDSQFGDSENIDCFSHSTATAMVITGITEGLEVVKGDLGEFAEIDSFEGMALCSRCGGRYLAIELTEQDLNLCPDCRIVVGPLIVPTPVPIIRIFENSPSLSMKISGEHHSVDAAKHMFAVPGSLELTITAEARASHHEEIVHESQTSYAEPDLNSLSNLLVQTLADEDTRRLVIQQVVGQPTDCDPSAGDTGAQQMQQLSSHPNLKLDVSEGAGISVLLKRSSSGKGSGVQGRTFTASTVPYGDPSYVRDCATSMRSSVGQGSTSASSSVDLGSARQTETRLQRQLSGRKSEIESHRHDTNTKHQRPGSNLSATPSHVFQGLGLATTMHEESLEVTVVHSENDVGDVTNAGTHEEFLVSESVGADDKYNEVKRNNHCESMVASTSELSTNALNIPLTGSSVTSFTSVEDSASYGTGDDFENEVGSISDQEASAVTPEPSTAEEDTMPSFTVDEVDVAQRSLDTISEIEVENGDPGSPVSLSDDSDVVSTNSKSTVKGLPEPSVATLTDEDMITSLAEPDTWNHAIGIIEESTVTVEGHGDTMARSLTLEEATDAILFCSSIVHNLAYEAATIAMEKERGNLVPLEGSRPMVTILGNNNSDVKHPRGRTGKRNSKSQKVRQKRVETGTTPSGNTDSNDKVDVSTTCLVEVNNKSDSMKPPFPKLESKCNCTIM